jgi:uncharacterized repeat protein (TIGR03803 family)
MGHSFKNFRIIAGAQLLVLVLNATRVQAQSAGLLPVPLPGSIQEIPAATASAAASAAQRPHISRATLTAAEGSASMDIEVVLKLRNGEELKGRVGRSEAVTQEEMVAKYQPLAADYQAVLEWLTGRGFRITRADASQMAIFARATVNQIQEVLGVKFARVISGNEEYTSAVTAPSVPAAMAPFILGINGLQPQIQPHEHIELKPASLTSSAPPYLPIQLATAYNANGLYGANLTGAGQAIALVTDSFPNTNDLQLFWSSYGVNQSLGNLSFIQVFSGPVPAPTGEETLDVEWSSALAPGAQVRVYASQGLALTAIDQCYAQIYNDVTENPDLGIHQMSVSFGVPENLVPAAQLQTDDQYFAELAAAGVTIFAASGDQGADPDPAFGAPNGAASPENPASDPNVTGVGGTTLTADSTGSAQTEVAWNNASGASGGGVSGYFERPVWQTGVGMPAGTTRLVPDVSSAADPDTGAAVILNGVMEETGGTSLSSPTWAAFCALLNQSRAQNGMRPLGLLGPFIYPFIGTTAFRDIISGNNSFGGGIGYNAGPGYDLATGIGVPDMSLLAQTLAGYSPPLTVSPGLTDGPPPATASTAAAYSFTFTASGFPPPIFTVTSGNLPPGMTLSVNGLLSGTPTQNGIFTVTVTASNGDGPNATQTFTIVVTTPPSPPVITGSGLPASATINLPLVVDYGSTGYPTPTFGVSSGALPTGLTLSAAGVVAGTPTQLGTFTGTITASNGNPPNATQGFNLTIVANPMQQIGTLADLIANGASLGAQDSLGNFYVTDYAGGTGNGGALVRITPAGQQTTLHHFDDGSLANDGQNPNGVILGMDGNLYGTTYLGGSDVNNPEGLGTIFAATTGGTLTLLHLFGDGSVADDGQLPGGNLVQGVDGNFYGTTTQGGSPVSSSGTVFQMTPLGTITILHQFFDGTVTNDGRFPYGALVQAADGNFYGTTIDGGSPVFHGIGHGSLFRITPAGAETILHGFGDGTVANDGQNPQTGLVQGLDGSLYGTTDFGGVAGQGTVFSLTAAGVYSVLHSFGDGTVANDASDPTPAQAQFTPTLIAGPDGNCYGVTEFGGFTNRGALFQITPAGVVTILHSFGDGTVSDDGIYPTGNLILGTDGNIYGLTGLGGASGNGTLFKVILNPVAPMIVSPAAPGGTFNVPYHYTYKASGIPAPTINLTSGALPSGLTLGANGRLSGTPVQAGIYTGLISASNGAGAPATQAFSITIQQVSQTIGAFGMIPNQIYGAAPFTITPPTASSGLPVTVTVKSGPATISGNTVTLTGAGTVILAGDQAGNVNYTAAPEVTTSFTVGQATQTIAAFPAITNTTFGVAPFAIVPPAASSGLPVTVTVKSGPATIAGNTITITGAGTVVLAADQAGNANYTAAKEKTASFTVAPATQTISPFAAITNATYGVAPFRIPIPTASSGLPVTMTIKSGPATIAGNTITVTGAGSVTVAADQAGNTNYDTAPEVTTVFTVAPAPQTISPFAGIASVTYGSAPFAIVPPAASSGLPVTVTVRSGPAKLSGDTVTITGAGTVVLAADQSGNSNYTAAAEVTTSFTVSKAAQTIAAFAAITNMTYGVGEFSISPPAASSGLQVTVTVKSGPATMTGNTVTVTGTGTVVLAADQGGSSNYTAASEVTTSFTVSKASQTIAPFTSITTMTYGNSGFSISLPAASSGLPVTVTVKSGPATISGDNITITGAGTVVLVANQGGNTNYNAAQAVTTSFTINKASQNITFSGISNMTYGAAAFSFSFPTASSGLPVTVTVKSGPATISGDIITLTGAGTVVLAADQAGNGNYTAAQEVTTSFGVSKASQMIASFPSIANKTLGVAPFSITAPTASSGLKVTVAVKSGPATISGNTVTLTGTGTVVLAADQAGNANYNAAQEVTTSFTVSKAN